MFKKISIISACLVFFCFNAGLAQHNHAHHQTPVEVDADALGKIDFPITGGLGVQKQFERGLALLHHMMYVMADKEFTALAKAKPNCAMAHWGVAIAIFHPLWSMKPSPEKMERGEAAIRKAQSITGISERERDFINAASELYHDWQNVDYNTRIAAWEQAQKKLHEKYPEDVDAAAFYALAQLATAPKSDQTFSHQKSAGALLDKLFAKRPEHPGVLHYTIHAYDNPMLAERAVPASRAYDKIAPDVPHALHMPTHIFVRLGIWPDAISWNIRSAKAALKYPAKDAISLHYPHALDYLTYGYLQRGEDANAKATLKKLFENENYQYSTATGYALAAIPARYALERKQWTDAAKLEVLNWNNFPWEKYSEFASITWFAKGLGAARSGDIATAQTSANELKSIHGDLKEGGENYWAVLTAAQKQTVEAWIAFAKNEKRQAVEMMREAADLEDSVDKHPVTPGAVLPARELLGDMLVLLNQPKQAIEAYEDALKISPNRLNSLTGAARAAELAGKKKLAKSYYEKVLAVAPDSDRESKELKRARKFLTAR